MIYQKVKTKSVTSALQERVRLLVVEAINNEKASVSDVVEQLTDRICEIVVEEWNYGRKTS